MRANHVTEVAIVGAGPSGLAAGIECQRAGLDYVIIEKGCIVNSLFNFPTQIVYFTTPELLEIGGLPLVCAHEKPTRIEPLKYYRRVAVTFNLRVRQYEKVLTITGSDNTFLLTTQRKDGSTTECGARKVILATGYYDNPKMIGIPGEELPKCSHYYSEAHPFYDCDVAVVGAGNSAIEAALELFRGGARVTMIHRGADLNEAAKYWVKPDIQNRIRNREITALFDSKLRQIKPATIVVEHLPSGSATELKNDFVFALTGYRPNYDFLLSCGIEIDPATGVPATNPDTLESNVPGIYVIGAIVAGERNNKVFIENGRLHGPKLIGGLLRSLRGTDGKPLHR